MTALQILRQSKLTARWVLVWFVLSLTAAIAAPLVNPQTFTLVCTSAGQTKLIIADSQATGGLQVTGAAKTGLHQHLDCVLCLALDVPPTYQPEVSAYIPLVGVPALWHAGSRVLRLLVHNVSARGPPAVARSLAV